MPETNLPVILTADISFQESAVIDCKTRINFWSYGVKMRRWMLIGIDLDLEALKSLDQLPLFDDEILPIVRDDLTRPIEKRLEPFNGLCQAFQLRGLD